MVKKEEFYYDSEDKQTKIFAIKWIPVNVEIRVILQIAHGMLEFVDRYDDFARTLAEKGILIVGNDHLGHGQSIMNEDDIGFFCKNNGNQVVLEDMHKLMDIIKKQYPDIPYFILGHSMGSFLVRQYITVYGNDIKGAIITGTGGKPYALIKIGELITIIIAIFKGWRYRSKFVDYMAIGGNNKKIKPSRTNSDWLTRDEQIVDAYIADKRTNTIFTLNAYYNMFKGMLYLYNKDNLERMPKKLPVIFLSGKEDTVGDFGKGVEKVYENFKKIGMKKVTMKLYKDARHEIINELQRETVYEDILNWINQNT